MKRRFRLAGLRAAATFLLLFAALPGISNAQSQPNIVLVTLDTTRADRIGFMGSKRGLTPQLDAVARQGVVFTRAYSQAPLTTVSHATMFTGTYPQFHKVNDFGIPLPKDLPALAELLKQRGYKTGAFVGSIILDPVNGMAPSFNRGFDVYSADYRRRKRGLDRYKTMENRAEQVVARASAWVKKNAAGPFFLWVHVFDPHEPYEAPAPYAQRFAKDKYDGEIAYTDAVMGGLFAELRALGKYDNTLIVVTADHGESLGDHGERAHGVFLYDETIHIPLLMKFPANQHAGRRVDALAGLVDLAPSVLDVAGVTIPRVMQGRSLVPLIGQKAPPERPVYSETDYPRRAFGWSSLATWRTGKYLFVRAPRPELYDTAADPGAKSNLAASNKSLAERFAADAEGFRKRSSGDGPDRQDRPVDPRIAEKLTSLGYVAGISRTAAAASGIDPKDKVDVANQMQSAMMALENERHDQVIPILEKVVATDPQIFIAQFQLGTAYARQREYAKAVAPLRKATELLPDTGMAHYELGLALYHTGDLKTSAAHFEIAADLMPGWSDAQFSLASVWARSDRIPDAMKKLRSTLEMDNEHYQANLLLGRILSLQGKAAEGLPYLEKAAASPEASGEAHRFLGDAYEQLGRAADAQRARAQAAKMGPPRRQ
jgi:arylsulfatase A-like enzyme/Tfp pilus assembly protein PilF